MSWTELSGSDVMEAGKTYKLKSVFERTSGDSPDSAVEAAFSMCASNAEIEEKIFRDTGAVVKVKNRYGDTERAGREYSYNIVFDSQETHSPALIPLAIMLAKWIGAIVVTYLITDTIKSTGNKAYEEAGPVGGIATNTMWIIGGVIVIIMLMRRKIVKV